MMDRRRFLLSSLAGVLAAPPGAGAQQGGKVYRIGILHLLPPGSSRGFEALRQGLRSLGYVEGRNIVLEYRWAQRPEGLSPAVIELLQLGVHIIVTADATTTAAAKRATSDIPIVMAASADPVAEGLVASLASPGGNITGLSSLSRELSGKRLELLRETVPTVARVVVLWNSGTALNLKMTEQAARRLHIDLQRIEARGADDVDNALRAAAHSGAGAVIVLPHPEFDRIRAQIAELGLKYRLPTLASADGFAKDGGLVQYGPSITDNWRRAARYVDKILRGAKPSDLPVEQPTKFELVINLKTAKALGLTIPPSLLARADQVIE